MTISKLDYFINTLIIFMLTYVIHICGGLPTWICWLLYVSCFLEFLCLILAIINERLKKRNGEM